MKYTVSTFRTAGLEARWTKINGTPFICVRNPESSHDHQRDKWWVCDNSMFKAMQTEGILAGFNEQTILGDIFGIPAFG